MVDNQAEQVAAIAGSGLAVNGVQVRLDRSFGVAADFGDLADRQPLDEQVRHLPFRRGEPPFAEERLNHLVHRRRSDGDVPLQLGLPPQEPGDIPGFKDDGRPERQGRQQFNGQMPVARRRPGGTFGRKKIRNHVCTEEDGTNGLR